MNLENHVAAVASNVVAQERSEGLLPGQLPPIGIPAFGLCPRRNEFKNGPAEHSAGLDPQKLAFSLVDPAHNPLLVQLVVCYRPSLEKVSESPLALDQLGQSPIQPESLELFPNREGKVAQMREVAFLLCGRTWRRFFTGTTRTNLRHWYSVSDPKGRGCLESRRVRRVHLLQAGRKVFAASVQHGTLADPVALADAPRRAEALVSRGTRTPFRTLQIFHRKGRITREKCADLSNSGTTTVL